MKKLLFVFIILILASSFCVVFAWTQNDNTIFYSPGGSYAWSNLFDGDHEANMTGIIYYFKQVTTTGVVGDNEIRLYPYNSNGQSLYNINNNFEVKILFNVVSLDEQKICRMSIRYGDEIGLTNEYYDFESTIQESDIYEDFYPVYVSCSDTDIKIFFPDGEKIIPYNSLGCGILPGFEKYDFNNLSSHSKYEVAIDEIHTLQNTNPFNTTARMMITSPRDEFKQAQLNTIAMTAYFENIPIDNRDLSSLEWEVTGYRNDRPREARWLDLEYNDISGTVSGSIQFVGAVLWNEMVMLDVMLSDKNNNNYYDNIFVTCYEDFIDDDGNGLDDRTGMDEWDGTSDFGEGFNAGLSEPWTGENFFSKLGDTFNSFGGMLSNLFSGLSNIGQTFLNFFKQVFNFLPPEFMALITLLLGVTILLRIFGR